MGYWGLLVKKKKITRFAALYFVKLSFRGAAIAMITHLKEKENKFLKKKTSVGWLVVSESVVKSKRRTNK